MLMKFFKHLHDLLFGKVPCVLPEGYSQTIRVRGFIPIHLHHHQIVNNCSMVFNLHTMPYKYFKWTFPICFVAFYRLTAWLLKKGKESKHCVSFKILQKTKKVKSQYQQTVLCHQWAVLISLFVYHLKLHDQLNIISLIILCFH